MPRTVNVPIDPVVVAVPVYDTSTVLTDEPDAAIPAGGGAGAGAGIATDFKQNMIRIGLPALLLGTLGTAVAAGLAFRSYKKTGSVVRPAIIIGVGGLAVSGISLAMLIRALSTTDGRYLAAGTGLWLAK